MIFRIKFLGCYFNCNICLYIPKSSITSLFLEKPSHTPGKKERKEGSRRKKEGGERQTDEAEKKEK